MSDPPSSAPRKASRRLIWVLVAVAVVSIVLGLVLPFLYSPPRFAPAEVTAVELRLPGRPPVVSTDPAAITAVVEAVNTSKHGYGVKYDAVARITLKRPAGDVELDVVPGRGDRVSIWVRCGGPEHFWEVDRGALARALAALGVTEFPARP